MKKWMKLVLVLSLVSVLFLAGCKEDADDPVASEFDTMLEYMDNNGMTIAELTTGWIIPASGIVDALDDYYIMDIRTGDANENGVVDYIDGHVPGAIASSYANIVTDATLNTDGKPIIVVCYTGQTAAASIAYLKVLGYDVKSIAYGFNNMYWSELPGHKWPKPTFQ